MTFDPTSLPQRLYLAEAIRCYIKDKNIPLAFNKKPDGEPIDCLLTRLKTFKTDDRPAGVHLDRNAIREIASPADNKPYPPHAAAVAAFLEDEGYCLSPCITPCSCCPAILERSPRLTSASCAASKEIMSAIGIPAANPTAS